MGLQNLLSYLSDVKGKILNSNPVGQEADTFEKMVAYDFIGRIFENPLTGSFYEARLFYYDILKATHEYKTLQQNLFTTIENFGLFLNKDAILEKAQNRFKNKLVNPFEKIKSVEKKLSSLEPDEDISFLDLKNFAKLAFNQDSYYLLGDHSYFTPSKDISTRVHFYAVFRQYEVLKTFFSELFFAAPEGLNKTEMMAIDGFNNHYSDLVDELERVLRIEPERKHLREYEEAYNIFAKNNPDSYFPGVFRLKQLYSHTNLERIKNDIEVIFNDLALAVDSMPPKFLGKNENFVVEEKIEKHQTPQANNSKEQNLPFIKSGSLVLYLDPQTNAVLYVKKDAITLAPKRNELRREDIYFIGELIRAQGGVVLKSTLLRSMGYGAEEDSEDGDSRLHRAANRLKKFGDIENITVKRDVGGYYLK